MSRKTIPPRTVQRNNIVFHNDQYTTKDQNKTNYFCFYTTSGLLQVLSVMQQALFNRILIRNLVMRLIELIVHWFTHSFELSAFGMLMSKTLEQKLWRFNYTSILTYFLVFQNFVKDQQDLVTLLSSVGLQAYNLETSILSVRNRHFVKQYYQYIMLLSILIPRVSINPTISPLWSRVFISESCSALQWP